MKKWFAPLLVASAAVGLSACGGAAPTPAPAQSKVPEVKLDTSWDNNNTDPYKGWVVKFRNGEYPDVFYRCDSNGTAYYVIWRGDVSNLSVVTKSPDCPAK